MSERSVVIVCALLVLFWSTGASAESLRLGTGSIASAAGWQVMIANEKHLWGDFRVEITDIQSTPIGIAGLISGELDVVSTIPMSAVHAIEKGADIRIVGLSVDKPFGGLYVKHTPIMSVGSTEVGNAITYMTELALKKLGYAPDKIYFYTSNSAQSRFAMLSAGAADAVLLHPPYSFMAESIGAKLEYELTSASDDTTPIFGYMSSTKWARSESAEKFAGVIREATSFFYDDENREECIDILRKYIPSASREIAEKTYDYYHGHRLFSQEFTPSDEKIKALLRASKSNLKPEDVL